MSNPINGATAATKVRPNVNVRSALQALGMLPILVVLAIGFHILTGRFLSVNNLSIVMQQASINTVLAAGMTFVPLRRMRSL